MKCKNFEECDKKGNWKRIGVQQADFETIEKILECVDCRRIIKEVYIYSDTIDEKGEILGD